MSESNLFFFCIILDFDANADTQTVGTWSFPKSKSIFVSL